MNSAQREQAWPYCAGVLVTLAWWYLLHGTFPADPSDLLSASGTISSVLIGFLATAKAIIMSASNSPTYQHIRNIGYADRLMDFIRSAIYAGLVFLVFATLGFFIDWNINDPDRWETIGIVSYKAGWVLSGSIGLFLYARIISLIFRVLKNA